MPGTRRFSIVIPTRGRPHTLASTLETCLNQLQFEDYDIVVCDNSDVGDRRSEQLVAARMDGDARAADTISYLRQPEVRAMARNFSDAIAHSTGEYVIVLGDDDGMLPMALFELDRLIAETGQAVLRWNNGLFNWPEMTISQDADYLGFGLQRQVRVRKGRDALAQCLATLRYEHLPMLYINAAVRRDVVDAMRDETGMLFHARSPDVYSAVLIAYRNETYLDVSVPLSLAGLSRGSNGVSAAFAGSNAAPKVDFDALNRVAGLTPHPHAPELPIFPLVALAESFLFAKARHFPDDDAFDLPRERLMRAYLAQADLNDPAARQAILAACEDDPALRALVEGALAAPGERQAPLRLKPERLGYDGQNLHLVPSAFGVRDIAGAVGLVHATIWSDDAPLRFDEAASHDAAGEAQSLLERTVEALTRANEEIVALRANLTFHRDELIATRERLAHAEANAPRRGLR